MLLTSIRFRPVEGLPKFNPEPVPEQSISGANQLKARVSNLFPIFLAATCLDAGRDPQVPLSLTSFLFTCYWQHWHSHVRKKEEVWQLCISNFSSDIDLYTNIQNFRSGCDSKRTIRRRAFVQFAAYLLLFLLWRVCLAFGKTTFIARK